MRQKSDSTYDDEGGLRGEMFPVILLIGLGGAFLFELVTLSGVPFVRDIQLFFLPHKRLVWEALQEGNLPLWTSSISSGYPVLANFQSAVFYPPHWLYAMAPFLTAFNWLIVMHLLVGGTGTYLLCREIRFSRTASWVAGVSFMLGGYFVSLTNLVNALQTAAWTPLLMLTLVRHVRMPSPWRFLAIVVVYLCAFLAGAPYTFAMAAAMSAVFVLVWSGESVSGGTGWKRAVVALSVAAVIVAGIAAVQILPTLRMVAESSRAGGLPLEIAGKYSIDPSQLPHLVFPNDFSDPTYEFGHKLQITGSPPWLYSIYLGVVPIILSLFAACDAERRREVLFWGGTAIVGLVLGLGPSTPAFGIVREVVPGFDAFRYPEKFFLLTGFAVPMLAAHGASAMRRTDGSGKLALVAASVVASTAVAVDGAWRAVPEAARSLITTIIADSNAAQHVSFAYDVWMTRLDQLTVLLVATVVAIILYRRDHLRNKVFTGLLVVLVCTDLWLAHRHLVPLVDPGFYRRPPRVASVLPMEDMRSSNRYWSTPFNEATGTYYAFPNLAVSTTKWLWQQTAQPNTGALHGMLTLDSSDAIHLDLIVDRGELLRELSDAWRWRLLELSSVSRLYSPASYDSVHYESRTALDSLPGFVYSLKDPLPRAYIGKGSLHSDPRSVLRTSINPARRGEKPAALLADSVDALERWARRRPGFALVNSTKAGHRGALRALERTPVPDSAALPKNGTSALDTGTVARSAGEEYFGDSEIVNDTGETVRVRVDPAEAGFLVLTDTPYPGWRVTVDGERRPLVRANHFYRAVPVMPGDREVVFRYRSEPLRRGGYISILTLLMLGGGLAGWKWRTLRGQEA